jgi:hypothetical protein
VASASAGAASAVGAGSSTLFSSWVAFTEHQYYVEKAEKENKISAHGGSLLSLGGFRGGVGFRPSLFNGGGGSSGSSYFRGRHYGVDIRELGTVG